MSFINNTLKTAGQYHQNGKLHQAEAQYRMILKEIPDNAEALHGLGIIAFQLKKYDVAFDFISKAIENKPEAPQFHYNCGLVLVAMKRQDEAIRAFQQAIQYKPDYADAYYNLALALKEQQQFEDAIENFEQSIRFHSDNADAYYNLGNTHKSLNHHEAAAESYNKAINGNPNFAKAYNNLAFVQQEQGHIKKAIENYRQAIHLKPEFVEAHWNLSLALLLNGEFKEGWKEHEWRFLRAKRNSNYPYRFGIPPWDGSFFEGKRLFVHCEQGLGDTIQFIRYLPFVKDRGGKVFFETFTPLINLLKGFPGIDELVELSPDRSLPESCNFYLPLMSLPYIFGTTIDTIPSDLPYIVSGYQKVEQWKTRMSGKGFKVGIVWAGKPEHENDRNRSCALESFATLALIPGLKLYGLQKGSAARQIGSLGGRMNLVNFDHELADMSETAAAIDNLDLVISVDTAVAHLAGAMGKPVWTLLPFAPDWRWLLNRDDSPWYPSMRLFRQKKHGDWDSVFKRIAMELEKIVSQTAF